MAITITVDKEPTFNRPDDVAIYKCDLTEEQYVEHMVSGNLINCDFVKILEWKNKEEFTNILNTMTSPTAVLVFSDGSMQVFHNRQSPPKTLLH